MRYCLYFQKPQFSVCTDAEVYTGPGINPDASFMDIVEFDLGVVRECASFSCWVESPSDLFFQVDPPGNH